MPKQIAAQCKTARRRFAVDIAEISPEGCSVIAQSDWPQHGLDDEDYFLHLSIAGRIEMNGRVESHQGRRANIRFFGQLHPAVVDELAKAQ